MTFLSKIDLPFQVYATLITIYGPCNPVYSLVSYRSKVTSLAASRRASFAASVMFDEQSHSQHVVNRK